MWGNTVAIHSVLKKKTSKLLTQLNMKKIKSTKTILEKKNYVGKHYSNLQCFKEKKIQS
jgi:hypothetical protein